MPNGYDRLKTLLDSTKDEDEEEEETTATGSSTKKSGKARLDALLSRTEGSDTPANARSKAAYEELMTTGSTTYRGKDYTMELPAEPTPAPSSSRAYTLPELQRAVEAGEMHPAEAASRYLGTLNKGQAQGIQENHALTPALQAEFVRRNSGQTTGTNFAPNVNLQYQMSQRADRGRAEGTNEEEIAAWVDSKAAPYQGIRNNKDYLANTKADEKYAIKGFYTATGKKAKYNYITNLNGFADRSNTSHETNPLMKYDFMTDNERKDYTYIANTQGLDAAEGYLDYLDYDLNARASEAAQAAWAKNAQGTGNAIGASATSVLANSVAGLGTLNLLGQNINKAFTGKPVDYNAPALNASKYTTTVRGQVAKDIEKAHPNATVAGVNLGSFLYQTGMSMADSAVVALLGSLGVPQPGIILGSSAAVNATLNAKERGLTDAQALTTGLASGIAEMLFESVSLEKIIHPTTAKSVGGVVKNILRQAFTEGSEEVATTLANTLTDRIINGDKSELLVRQRELQANGMNEEDARKAAWKEWWIGLATDALGGAISGGLMGAGANVSNYMSEANYRATGDAYKQMGMTNDELRAALVNVKQNTYDPYTREWLGKLTDRAARGEDLMQKLPSAEIGKVMALQAGLTNTVLTQTEYNRIARLNEAPYSRVTDEASQTAQEAQEAPRAAEAPLPARAENAAETQGRRLTLPTVEEAPAQNTQQTLTMPTAEERQAPAPRAQAEKARTEQNAPATLTLPTVVERQEQNAPQTLTLPTVNSRTAETEEQLIERLKKSDAGLAQDDYTATMDQRTVKLLDTLAKKLGLRVAFADEVNRGKANADITGNVVLIEKGNPNPVRFLIGHEATHWMKRNADGGYNAFEKAARKADAVWFQNREAEIRQAYQKQGISIDEAGIREEAVSDYAGLLADNSDTLERFITENKDDRNALEKVRDFFRHVKEFLTGDERAKVERAERRLIQALQQTERTVASGEAQTEAESGTNLSIKPSLPNDFDRVLANTFPSDTDEVVIGDSSDFLTKVIGAKPLLVTMPATKAYAAMATEERARQEDRYDPKLHYHGLGKEGLITALSASENPVLAFVATEDPETGKPRDDYLVLVTDEKRNGKNIIVVQQVSTTGQVDNKRVKVNKEITAYDRDQLANDIEKAVEEHRVLHVDKERAHTLASGRPGFTSLTAMTEDELKANIARFWNNVNWKKSPASEFTADTKEVTKNAFQLAYEKAEAKAKQNSLKGIGTAYFSAANSGNEEVGATLRTAKGSPIKRSSKYGVGKEIGGRVYFHKQYAEDVIPTGEYERAQQIVAEEYPDFTYNCVEYEPKTGTIRFDEAPGFDIEREPAVGDYVEVKADGSTRKGHTDYIWHHKWSWVKNDYQGFDVAESWNWSKQWLAAITGKTYEVNGKQYNDNGKSDGNGIERWNAQLDAYGLPRDGGGTASTEGSPVSQEIGSAGTSRNQVATLFTDKRVNFGDVNIDIGGGRWDKTTNYLAERGTKNMIFDPFNRSEESNTATLDYLSNGGRADTATCANVLNVIREPEARANVILETAKAIKPDGTAYFVVYEGNGTGVGKETRDGWQENRKTEDYVDEIKQYFDAEGVQRYGKLIVARHPKENLPAAQWGVTPDKAIKYSLKGLDADAIPESVRRYGRIQPGENPARDIQVPKKVTEDKNERVSQTIRTVLEAGATPDAAVPTISELVEKGAYSYQVYSDKDAIAKAEDTIKDKGWEAVLTDWVKDVSDGTVNKTNTALGWALYNNAANEGDLDTALNVLDLIVRHQRNAAQAVQATRILKQLTPEAQLYGVQRSVDNLIAEIKQKYGKDVDIQVNRDLARAFLNAKTEDERRKALEALYKDVGRQLPSRFVDKWNAWRYLAMLGNPRTHVRNIVGNAGFAPVVLVKDQVGTMLERIAYRLSNGKMERTKGLVLPGWDHKLVKAAWDRYDEIMDEALGAGKYTDMKAANDAIQQGRVIFKFKPLEWARRGNSAALDKEDIWFNKPHYVYAMAQYCKANDITPAQIASGKGLEKAEAYAIKEAQKATYRDINAFSNFVSNIGRSTDRKTPVGKVASAVIEGILPFRRTPANILARGVEYSPLGLAKSLTYDMYQVMKKDADGNPRMTVAEMLDNVSAGLTGTGLLALGMLLSKLGLLRGHGEDDEKARNFDDLTGHQNYALQLPNGDSYTLDWLAPEALPVFVGVNLYERMLKTKGEMKMNDLLKAVSSISEPMLEMSMIQGINDLLETVSFAKNNETSALFGVLSEATISYLTQAFPTLLGQSERTGENVRMTTYTDKNKWLMPDLQYSLGKVSAKTPGWDYDQIPYIDAWGRTEVTGDGWLERAFKNMINPGYTDKVRMSDMEKELLRLYNLNPEDNGGVLPTRPSRKIGETDLTGEQYVQYATKKGQLSYELAEGIIKSAAYKKASDAERVEMIKDAYDYANEKGRAAAIPGYKPSKSKDWMAEMDETVKATKVSRADYISARYAVSQIKGIPDGEGGTITNSAGLKKMDYLYGLTGLTQSQREAMMADFGVGKTLLESVQSKDDVNGMLEFIDADIPATEYKDYKIASGVRGIDLDTYMKGYNAYYDADGSGTKTNDDWTAVLDKQTFSKDKAQDSYIKGVLWQLYTNSTSTKNNPYDKSGGQYVLDEKDKAKAGGKGTGSNARLVLPTAKKPWEVADDMELRSMNENGGNVDLTNRKSVPVTANNLATVKGWGMDAKVGDRMTVASQTFRDGNTAVVVTPILPDGTLMTQRELENYWDTLRGTDYASADKRGIILGVFDGGSWKDNLAESEAFAERVHELHERKTADRRIKLPTVESVPKRSTGRLELPTI